MKHAKLLLMILAFLIPMMANADPVEINGIYYNLVSKVKTAEVTENPNSYSGEVVIPETVTYGGEEYSVTSIGKDAFYACSSLTSVTIPNSVTSIGYFAFDGCSSLATITLGSGVSHIGKRSFAACSELTDVYCMSADLDDLYCENNAFEGSPIEYATLHVLKSSIDAYKSAEPWKNFKSIVKIDFPKHNLTYYVDGEEYKKYEIEEFEPITPEAEPSKPHYTFSGWSTIPSVMPAEDVTVTGTFSNIYKLVYRIDNSEYKSYDVEYGTAITPEKAPAKEGYTFYGWYDGVPETMPAHDVTLSGYYTVNSYRVEYLWPNGDIIDCYYVNYGNPVPQAPSSPEREGYTFTGWDEEVPETMPAKNLSITATCTINKYKLTYVIDGVEYKSLDVEYGASITCEPDPPSKEGYSFWGWEADWSGWYFPEIMPAEDVTVNGHFEINTYTVEYFDPEGGVLELYEVEYGAPVPQAPSSPEREGYTFTGWDREIPETMPAKDLFITATYKINKYKLIYMVDGTEYKSYKVKFDSHIDPEPAPTKEGYIFSGWDYVPEWMPAETVTVTGSFTMKKVKVSLSENKATIEKGKTLALKATLKPSDLSVESLTWKSSDTNVATVTSAGKVKGVKAGTVTITCTYKPTGAKATCKVTIGYVKLDKNEAVIEKDKTVTLKATVYPSSSDQGVTWKSSDTKIATVTSAGKVKGVKAGKATITCTSKETGLTATCAVTVGYVKLDQTEANLLKGKTMTLKATVYPSSSDQGVTWKSSDTKIATVTSAGKVKGVKTGKVTITCTSNATGLKTTSTVNVVDGIVKLDKAEAYVQKDNTITLKATVTPSSLKDKSVTWKSSDTKIATVTSSGKVKGVGYGTVTITCTSKATGTKATCKVIVGKVIISMSEFTIKRTRSNILTATVLPSDLADQSVTWKSSNTSVATVTADGKVTGVKAGTATITCTSKATGLKGTCRVTVLQSVGSFIHDENGVVVTDINELEEPAVEEPFDVYDLNGRKVKSQVTSLDGLPRGIYIINGKKVMKQ